MSIKRSVVSLLVGAGLAVGSVGFGASASADTSSLGASLNRGAAEEPAPDAQEDPAPVAEDEDEGFARKGASLN